MKTKKRRANPAIRAFSAITKKLEGQIDELRWQVDQVAALVVEIQALPKMFQDHERLRIQLVKTQEALRIALLQPYDPSAVKAAVEAVREIGGVTDDDPSST